MDAREFVNLQEALVWMLYPIIQVLLAILLSASVFTALFEFFARVARYLTRARSR